MGEGTHERLPAASSCGRRQRRHQQEQDHPWHLKAFPREPDSIPDRAILVTQDLEDSISNPWA